MIKDSTDKTPIIICELLIEEMSKESCYNMTNMRVQRYLDERIVKTTLISEVSLNGDIEVTANDDIVYILFTNETKIVAKVVTADLKTLAQTYLCSICNMSFSIENELGWCINCNNVSFTTNTGSYILKDDDQSKLHICVFHSIIQRKSDLLSNTEQNVIV